MARRTLWTAVSGITLLAGVGIGAAALSNHSPANPTLAVAVGDVSNAKASPASAVGPNSAAPDTPAPNARECDRGPWADRVQGRPDGFDAGDRGGDYLWHDNDGFHLRVTHKGDDRAVYTGVIHSPTPLRIEPVKLENGDVAALSADRRTLAFRFADYGHIDGVDFHTDCAPHLTVTDLKVGNNPLPADRVYLGDAKVHPAHIPFTIHREQ